MQLWLNLDWMARLCLAAVCGGLIGYERSRQRKSAGMRTHMVVAIAAALIMIVSKYGFVDVIHNQNVVLDPSRIAAQIISGISFIGAGTILVKKDQVSGLTTAAGVWATAAIGMTTGAGLYWIAIVATLLLVFVQLIFHDDSLLNHLIKSEHVRLQITTVNQATAVTAITTCLAEQDVRGLTTHIVTTKPDVLEVNVTFVLNDRWPKNKIMLALQQLAVVQRVVSLDDQF